MVSVLVSPQVHELYVNMGFTNVLYNLSLFLIWTFLPLIHTLSILVIAVVASCFLLITSSASPRRELSFLAIRQLSLFLSVSLSRSVFSVLSSLTTKFSFFNNLLICNVIMVIMVGGTFYLIRTNRFVLIRITGLFFFRLTLNLRIWEI